MAKRLIVAEIQGGVCLGVHGAPSDWEVKIVDWDNLAEDENRTELEEEAAEDIKRALAQNE